MVNPHLDNGTPWGGSAPYERPMRPERPPGQPSSGPHTGYGGPGINTSQHEASHQGYNPGQDPRPNIGRDRMGIMSQPGGYGSDTYNALVGGANRPQQGGGFDRRKWSSALGHPEMAAVDPSDWRTILKILQTGGDPGTETQETQTSYNVGDTYPLEGGGGGYGTRGPLDRTPGNLPELQTIPLDMQFDQWGNPIGGDDFGYFDDDFAALSGSGGMNNEMLMAELTQDQKNYMRNPLFSPGLESAPSADELFNRVKDREDKGSWWPEMLGGRGPQEPTTRDEFDEYYNELKNSYYS